MHSDHSHPPTVGQAGLLFVLTFSPYARLLWDPHPDPTAVKQLLLKGFTMDSLNVRPMQTTPVPGVDFMTDYDSWLHIQVWALEKKREKRRAGK